jgi:diaminopimelate decarboxylase
VICDAGMNDLIRPSLYQAFHRIEAVAPREGESTNMDLVGPVCESGDFFAKDREFPPVEPGDLVAVRSAGAYSFTMASNYNSRPRTAEVLVDGDRWAVIRERETLDDLIRGESADPDWRS